MYADYRCFMINSVFPPRGTDDPVVILLALGIPFAVACWMARDQWKRGFRPRTQQGSVVGAIVTLTFSCVWFFVLYTQLRMGSLGCSEGIRFSRGPIRMDWHPVRFWLVYAMFCCVGILPLCFGLLYLRGLGRWRDME